MVVPPQYAELVKSLKALYKSSDYSDFRVLCGSDVYHVHKAVVCSQSEFFAAACKFGQEAAEGQINLTEDGPARVKAMIQYLYCLEYDIPESENTEDKEGLVFHAEMYSIADKYNIRGLKSLAQDLFQKSTKKTVVIKEFATAIRTVFETTVDEDRGLRDIVVEIMTKNMDLLDEPEIKEAVKETSSLAFELLMKNRQVEKGPWRALSSRRE